MKKRWLTWLSVLLLAVFGLMIMPTPRLILWGWLSNESFYRQRPTSWWSRELRQWEIEQVGSPFSYKVPYATIYVRQPTFWESWIENVLGVSQSSGKVFPLEQIEPGAVPVLVELLRDENAKTRSIASISLRSLGDRAKTAWPALLALLKDEDEAVRAEAQWTLLLIDPQAAKQAGVLVYPGTNIVVGNHPTNPVPEFVPNR